MIALKEALEIANRADAWNVNDDLCDCPNQRTFSISNPYHGVTEEIRLCCLFGELKKQYPQFFRTTVQEPAEWNGETDMPRSIWHRQLATHLGVSVSEARSFNLEPPRGTPVEEKPRIWLPWSGEFAEVILG